MIGRAAVSLFPFYDRNAGKMSFKKRPVLIIGEADSADYVVLPISRVTNMANLDAYYDVTLEPAEVPTMNLTQVSYIRTHKQTVIHKMEISKIITDFKSDYPDLFIDIMAKVEEFQNNLIDQSI